MPNEKTPMESTPTSERKTRQGKKTKTTQKEAEMAVSEDVSTPSPDEAKKKTPARRKKTTAENEAPTAEQPGENPKPKRTRSKKTEQEVPENASKPKQPRRRKKNEESNVTAEEKADVAPASPEATEEKPKRTRRRKTSADADPQTETAEQQESVAQPKKTRTRSTSKTSKQSTDEDATAKDASESETTKPKRRTRTKTKEDLPPVGDESAEAAEEKKAPSRRKKTSSAEKKARTTRPQSEETTPTQEDVAKENKDAQELQGEAAPKHKPQKRQQKKKEPLSLLDTIPQGEHPVAQQSQENATEEIVSDLAFQQAPNSEGHNDKYQRLSLLDAPEAPAADHAEELSPSTVSSRDLSSEEEGMPLVETAQTQETLKENSTESSVPSDLSSSVDQQISPEPSASSEQTVLDQAQETLEESPAESSVPSDLSASGDQQVSPEPAASSEQPVLDQAQETLEESSAESSVPSDLSASGDQQVSPEPTAPSEQTVLDQEQESFRESSTESSVHADLSSDNLIVGDLSASGDQQVSPEPTAPSEQPVVDQTQVSFRESPAESSIHADLSSDNLIVDDLSASGDQQVSPEPTAPSEQTVGDQAQESLGESSVESSVSSDLSASVDQQVSPEPTAPSEQPVGDQEQESLGESSVESSVSSDLSASVDQQVSPEPTASPEQPVLDHAQETLGESSTESSVHADLSSTDLIVGDLSASGDQQVSPEPTAPSEQTVGDQTQVSFRESPAESSVPTDLSATADQQVSPEPTAPSEQPVLDQAQESFRESSVESSVHADLSSDDLIVGDLSGALDQQVSPEPAASSEQTVGDQAQESFGESSVESSVHVDLSSADLIVGDLSGSADQQVSPEPAASSEQPVGDQTQETLKESPVESSVPTDLSASVDQQVSPEPTASSEQPVGDQTQESFRESSVPEDLFVRDLSGQDNVGDQSEYADFNEPLVAKRSPHEDQSHDNKQPSATQEHSTATKTETESDAQAMPGVEHELDLRGYVLPGALANEEDVALDIEEEYEFVEFDTKQRKHHKNRKQKNRGKAKDGEESSEAAVEVQPETETSSNATELDEEEYLADLEEDETDQSHKGHHKDGAQQRKANRKMFFSVLAGERIEVALTQEGKLCEYYLDMQHQKKLKGNIYKGIIQNIDTNLQAAFVNYGTMKNGFLQMDEIHKEYWLAHHEPSKGSKFPPIQKVIKPGQEVLVQVVKEPTGNKGAFLTTWLSLAGRFLVLTPGQDQIGVSRKVEDEAERARLKELINGIDPGDEMGVIVRTVSEGTTKATLKHDLMYLKRIWNDIRKKATEVTAPALIYTEPNLVERAIRDYLTEDVAEIWVDDEEVAETVRNMVNILFPKKKDLVHVLADKKQGLWDRFNLRRQIEQVYAREVFLPSGGRLVFDQTEALMAIDVNSGKISCKGNFETMAYKTNMEAAESIAKQLRLRDVGGQVVIDFIEMREKKHIEDVERSLRTAMKADKARYDIEHMSSFGLLELVRQRTGFSALSITQEPCPFCSGTGQRRNLEWQSLQVANDIQRLMRLSRSPHCVYETTQELGMYLLNHKRDMLQELEQMFGKTLEISLRKSPV